MNRIQISLVAFGLSAALAACGDRTPEPAADKADGGMMAPESMPMKNGMDGMMKDGATAATGSGVVTAIDKSAGTITIQHGPIPAVQWPAMTMAFKASPPSLLDQVSVGDNVRFEMTTQGNQVTAVHKQ